MAMCAHVLIHAQGCVSGGRSAQGAWRGWGGGPPICSWANHTDGAIYKTAPPPPHPCLSLAHISKAFFENWGREGGGPGRAAPASAQLSARAGSGWGVCGGGHPQLQVCTRCCSAGPWAGSCLPPPGLRKGYSSLGPPFPLGIPG